MALFDLPASRSTVKKDSQLIGKVSKPVVQSTAVKMKGPGKITDRIQAVVAFVKSKFEGKEDDLLLIQDESILINYIDKCIDNNTISIDTETTGLDPILDDIVGICIYTPGMKPAYIPINHVSYITNIRCAGQLDIDIIAREFQRLIDADVRSIWFNAPFDIRFIGNKLGIWMIPYFDTSVAAMCLNSEEPAGQRKLKTLHNKYCWGGKGESLTFGKLFDDIPFNLIPIKTAYLYAASDAIYTYELYEFQAQYLEPTGRFYESKHMQGVSYVFFEIEMKSMPTFISMEQTGVAIDFEYAEKLSERYHAIAERVKQDLDKACEPYLDKFDEYRRLHPDCRLTDPINFESPVQLAIILYDILKIPPIDVKNPRATGADILQRIDHPICKAILDTRAFSKVLSTYVDILPETAKQYPDKRIHCKLNQTGTSTGRASSNHPNLQNIPSRPFILSDGTKIDSGHDVRQLFTASPGYILMSCDYSGQEPRVTAHMSHDEKMIEAYRAGRDVYSEIAAISFGLPYEECLEHRPDGTVYEDGKARRGEAKKIVLGRHTNAPIHRNVC